jgi:hypothetical protein
VAPLGRKRDREEEELGLRADGGEIRKVHGDGSAPQPLRFFPGEKVGSFDEQVRGGGEAARARCDDGGIVAGTDPDSGAIRQESLERFEEAVFRGHRTELLFLESQA